MGDLNVNFLGEDHTLKGTLDTLKLPNVVKCPTCFKSKTNPSLYGRHYDKG